ncbi:MAG: DUF4097 family beta strand repeat-containing protein [Gemmatimonadaceae bacterium]|jgi:hypothetical protein|nr:DUF4097 family beta strand repeat-containing protein [Gemmatimonadaceae bacterium]
MTRHLLLVLIPLLGSAGLVVPFPSEQPVVRGLAASADVTMRLYVPAGDVTVETWDRDSVHLAGQLGANASVFGGGTRTHIKLGIEARSNADSTLPRASLRVRVPRGARLWIKMIDGQLLVSGTRAELEAYTVRGAITVRDVAGITSVESIDAPVIIAGATGDLRVRGSRGRVSLTDVTATMSVSTVSGEVTLTRTAADGRVETIGGRIAVDGVAAGGTLELQSHNGAIEVQVPATRIPMLTLTSRSGTVTGAALRGNTAHGTIIARSFKGDVRAVATDRVR